MGYFLARNVNHILYYKLFRFLFSFIFQMDPEFVSEFCASLLYFKKKQKKNNGVDLPAYPHSLSSSFVNSFLESISAKTYYNRCSKILNTSCLPKRARQTVQTQIRISLIRIFFVCYSDKLFL